METEEGGVRVERDNKDTWYERNQKNQVECQQRIEKRERESECKGRAVEQRLVSE